MNEVLTPACVSACLRCSGVYEKSRRTGNKFLCPGCLTTNRWCVPGSHLVSVEEATLKMNCCRSCAKAASKQSRDERRELLNNIKLASGCVDCGYKDHPAALDFDHRPGAAKLFDISRGTVRSWEATLLEIEKCVVRCANCHRVETCERG